MRWIALAIGAIGVGCLAFAYYFMYWTPRWELSLGYAGAVTCPHFMYQWL